MKPKSKPQAKTLKSRSKKRERTYGLWATTNVLWATDPPTYPMTFKGSMWDFMVQIPAQSSKSVQVDSRRSNPLCS